MRLPRQKVVAVGIVVAAAVPLVAALTGCTTEGQKAGASSVASGTPRPTATSSQTPTPAPTIEAVLVVAGVDVDGKHVSASGYVQGVIEDGGKCVFTYEREGATVTAEHDGAADRMTTSCGLVQSPIDQFVRGSWNLTLSYDVQGKTYISAPTTVEIP